ncbi:MAG: amidophosphoribosyltransferase [Deltaproteobacteria bacterium]|nr:amidophosphoribosyltransferase [Deltaproteobacteria bacterium]
MGGVFGVVSKEDCVLDLFYGTDFHSHLGTRRGGLAVRNANGFSRFIHNIENAQFRSKFDDDITKMKGSFGIGCISDTEDQPLIIGSHLGNYAIVTVGRINNLTEIVDSSFEKRTAHFSETTGDGFSPTEVTASIINTGESMVEGIRRAQELIDGSCSILLLTEEGIYAGRDRFGRTPLIIGEKDGSYCVTVETSAFPNLGYRFQYELGPGEIVLITPDGIELKAPPGDELRICSFLWIYFGYPSSTYEGRNVEEVRNRCGAALARNDDVEVDCVAGIPDSGTAHAIGYANESRIPYLRPFVKYTPTWPRSFMPQNQEVRDLVARMKLIPIREFIQGRRLLFCEDSIVRGTQLGDTIQRLLDSGAKEVHMRPACPPLIYGCRFLNFSRSKSELDLAGRRSISEMVGHQNDVPLEEYSDHTSDKYNEMVERIRNRLNLTTLKYQTLPDMVEALGMPKDQVCTYCWDGRG